MPFATLPLKPTGPIFYELISPPDSTSSTPLVVFINGLGLPASSWRPAISQIQSSKLTPQPRFLIYDRYGQGETTSRDPLDSLPGREEGYGHDLSDMVTDLHALLTTLVPAEQRQHLVLVAISIGVHIARLYAHQYPGTVERVMLLDSNIGNAEFTDFWPNPHASGFDAKAVEADDCTVDQYVKAYDNMERIFDSSAKNKEGLDRRNIRTLLPDPAAPKLTGPDGRGPWLMVAGHDAQRFAEESLGMEVPKSISLKYTEPSWRAYNEKMLKLSDADRTTGVLVAPGAGHFIQRDNPEFVAEQVVQLLQRTDA